MGNCDTKKKSSPVHKTPLASKHLLVGTAATASSWNGCSSAKDFRLAKKPATVPRVKADEGKENYELTPNKKAAVRLPFLAWPSDETVTSPAAASLPQVILPRRKSSTASSTVASNESCDYVAPEHELSSKPPPLDITKTPDWTLDFVVCRSTSSLLLPCLASLSSSNSSAGTIRSIYADDAMKEQTTDETPSTVWSPSPTETMAWWNEQQGPDHDDDSLWKSPRKHSTVQKKAISSLDFSTTDNESEASLEGWAIGTQTPPCGNTPLLPPPIPDMVDEEVDDESDGDNIVPPPRFLPRRRCGRRVGLPGDNITPPPPPFFHTPVCSTSG